MLVACGDQKAGSGTQAPSTSHSQSRSIAGAEKLKACPSTPSKPPVSNGLPDVSLPCLGSGPDIRLADLRGPLVVNVWAQWCGPCREEAPYLAELLKKADGKVQLLGIDYADPRPELAVRFAVEQKWDYPHVVDSEKATQQPLKIGGPPLTAFVDKEGAVVYVHHGVLTSQQQLDQLVKDKLGVSW
jgi:cytochrome c biogenesis protein CcmG/thiol:disulfide interchange protein DsbE